MRSVVLHTFRRTLPLVGVCLLQRAQSARSGQGAQSVLPRPQGARLAGLRSTKVAGPEGPERDPAAAWLRAILAQALKDEKSGDAPWEPTPFFGEGPRNPALELRKAIAKTILESDPMPGAVPILAWYFEEEVCTALAGAGGDGVG